MINNDSLLPEHIFEQCLEYLESEDFEITIYGRDLYFEFPNGVCEICTWSGLDEDTSIESQYVKYNDGIYASEGFNGLANLVIRVKEIDDENVVEWFISKPIS